jgi:hypothetical protein
MIMVPLFVSMLSGGYPIDQLVFSDHQPSTGSEPFSRRGLTDGIGTASLRRGRCRTSRERFIKRHYRMFLSNDGDTTIPLSGKRREGINEDPLIDPPAALADVTSDFAEASAQENNEYTNDIRWDDEWQEYVRTDVQKDDRNTEECSDYGYEGDNGEGDWDDRCSDVSSFPSARLGTVVECAPGMDFWKLSGAGGRM